MFHKNHLLGIGSFLALCLSTGYSQLHAADDTSLPAVSGINGKLDIRGGSFNDSGGGLVTGAISIPLEKQYGLQIDAAAGSIDSDTVTGGAMHLFWRDPAEGLLGFYGSYSHSDHLSGIDMQRFSVEGERYMGRFSLSGLAGMETGDPGDSFFSILDASYYPDENIRLYAGHRYAGPGHAGVAGVEWQLPTETENGIALFAEADKGEGDHNSATFGLRFYFGQQKSLINRHREDDPIVRSADDVTALAQCTKIPECKKATPPASSTSGSGGGGGSTSTSTSTSGFT